MFWYDDIYLGMSAKIPYRKIKRQIQKRKIHHFVYLIAVSDDSSNILEIIPSGFLMQKAYPTESLRIIGMALTKKEALKMSENIILDVYLETGGFDVDSWFRIKNNNKGDGL